MEIEPLNETEIVQTEVSPLEQFRAQWRQQPGFIPFVKQKNVIDDNAELLPFAAVAALPQWASPRAFAFQGLVLAAAVMSLLNWSMTRDSGKVQDEIVALQANVQAEVKREQGIMDAAEAETKKVQASRKPIVWKNVPKEEALQQLENSQADSRKSLQEYLTRMRVAENDLRSKQRAEAIINSGTPLIFSLALVLAAGLVASSVRRAYPKSNVRAAGDYYLYLATAGGLWPNLVFLVFMHFALSADAYGLAHMSETVGPLFWGLFWIGFYCMLVRFFAVVSRDMYKTMQIRPPASEWSLENKMLVQIHNSFLMMFVTLESIFLSAAYVLYLVNRRFA